MTLTRVESLTISNRFGNHSHCW